MVYSSHIKPATSRRSLTERFLALRLRLRTPRESRRRRHWRLLRQAFLGN